jgi:hypothetical protein
MRCRTGDVGQVCLTLRSTDFEKFLDTAQTLGGVVGDESTGTVLGVEDSWVPGSPIDWAAMTPIGWWPATSNR